MHAPRATSSRSNRAISVRFPISDQPRPADADDLIKARTRNSARSMCNRFKRLRAPHRLILVSPSREKGWIRASLSAYKSPRAYLRARREYAFVSRRGNETGVARSGG